MTTSQDAAVGQATGPRTGITLGATTLWLSVIVLLPLAAIVMHSFDNGWGGFLTAITAPAAVSALLITVVVSLIVATLNAVLGTVIAYVLVRDRFWGSGFVNALIDLPFALPTIVVSIVLLALYGPNSPISLKLSATAPALVIALAFVTLPFVVRQVQPVLIEADVEAEEAAASLGAHNYTIWREILLPTLIPSILSGAGLAFTRAIGEFGSVVLIGGNIPGKTQVMSQYIQQQIEIDQSQSAAATSVVLLIIAVVVLTIFRVAGSRSRRWGALHRVVTQRRPRRGGILQ